MGKLIKERKPFISVFMCGPLRINMELNLYYYFYFICLICVKTYFRHYFKDGGNRYYKLSQQMSL